MGVMEAARAISIRWTEAEDRNNRFLADALRRDGIDLTKAVVSALTRGTPLYVESDADLSDVRLRMARAHCRMLPVLHRGLVLGLIDLTELADRASPVDVTGSWSSSEREEVSVRAATDPSSTREEVKQSRCEEEP